MYKYSDILLVFTIYSIINTVILGKTDPLWFCQISYCDKQSLTNINELKEFLTKHFSSDILKYASDKSLQDFCYEK